MKEQTVYVPVKISDNPPSDNQVYFTYNEVQSIVLNMDAHLFDLNQKQFFVPDPQNELYPTHYLQPKQALILAKEDAEKIKEALTKALNAAPIKSVCYKIYEETLEILNNPDNEYQRNRTKSG